MPDYIPAPDDKFDTYVRDKFGPYLNAHAAALHVATADLASFNARQTAWSYTWPGFQAAESALRGATQDKNTWRKSLEEAIRLIAGKIQADRTITAAQKEALGLPVRKTTRTPVPVPTTTPTMQRIDTSTRTILRLFFVDATAPDSKAKPKGVQGCEIREQIGGTAPTDPEVMSFLAVESRSPYRADFEAGDVGKTAYFALRWMNTRGEPGPWSQIYSAAVPS